MLKRVALFIAAVSLMTSCAWASINWNDGEPMTLFLARHYNFDPVTVVSVGQIMQNYDDDTSVALFLSKLSGADPIEMLKMRVQGKSWLKVMDKFAIAPSVLFFDLGTKDLPGRYSYAFRQYEKFKKDSCFKMQLYDGNVRDLVQLRLLKEGLGKKPEEVMKKTSEGVTFTEIIMDSIKNDSVYRSPAEFYINDDIEGE